MRVYMLAVSPFIKINNEKMALDMTAWESDISPHAVVKPKNDFGNRQHSQPN